MNATARQNLATLQRTSLLSFLAAFLFFFNATRLQALQSVVLAWNPTPNAAGYMVYTSEDGVNFHAPVDAGASTALPLTGLQEGTTNYFYVTAYDGSHNESSPSATISYLVPGALIMTVNSGSINSARPSAPPSLNFTVIPGVNYQIQASVDLANWTTIFQTNAAVNGWITYQDPLRKSLERRFYRVVHN